MNKNVTHQNNKRIAKNTLFLYVRMLLVMAVSIYTSRVVLAALGVSDYGIYNVVGGIVAFLGFLNSSMANAVQRFLSFELGKGDEKAVNHIFCISLMSHIAISFFFLLILECFGPWFLQTQMSIPVDRLVVAHWVFQCSIVTMIFGFIQVPYNAIIIAKEEMDIYAYIGILEVILRLLIVFLLQISPFDKLQFYAILQMLVTVGILWFYMIYCRRKFVEAKFHIVRDRATFLSISRFAAWNLFGEFSWAMTGQGVNVILNIFCGTIVNAARGIAEQVNAAVMRFINSFQVALNPQVIKTYSSGHLQEMWKLLNRGCRFSFYLLLLLSMPLILEMDFVLNLWLVEVPEYATAFCQLVLVCSLVSIITNLFAQVVRATGKIRNYQVSTAIMQLMNFPLSYALLYWHFSPIYTMVVAIGVQAAIGIMRLFFVRRMLNYSIWSFMEEIFIPILKVAALSAILPIFVVLYCESGLLRFLTVCVLSALSVALCSYFLGMERGERARVSGILSNVWVRLHLNGH